jgi:GMP synthase-like glutamine amidotransferase
VILVISSAGGDTGFLEQPLRGRGYEVRTAPSLGVEDATDEDVEAIVVTAGTAAVFDADAAEADDVAGIGAAVAAGKPVLAVGPGVQQLAVALGGKVTAREHPEAAYVALHRTEPGRDHPVVGGWPDGSWALSLHRDEVVRLPDGSEQLLLGSDGPAAWSVGSALALSVRVDVDADTVAGWLGAGAGRELAEAAGVDTDELTDEARLREPFSGGAGRSLLARWVDALG